MPLITIVTVCYNDREGLAKTAASVEGQTFRDLEHLVVDGASTDGTADLLDDLARPWRRIISEPDKGLYDAMNKAVAAASGDYIQFLNAGDVYASPGSLADAAPLMDGDAGLISLATRNERNERSAPLGDGRAERYDSYGRHEAMIFATHLHRAAPYDLRYKIKADRDAILRMLRAGAKVVNDDQVFLTIESIGASSTQIPRKEKENIQITWRQCGLSLALARSVLRGAARVALFRLSALLGLDWQDTKRMMQRGQKGPEGQG